MIRLISRRDGLLGGLGLFLGSALPSPLLAAAPRADEDPVAITPSGPLPFDPPAPEVLNASGKKVFAWWHWFMRSFDNISPPNDYYSVHFLNPLGQGHSAYGSFIRERPLGRPPLSGDWQVQDMMAEVVAAKAAGLTGFQFNVLSADKNSRDGMNLLFLLEAAKRVGGFEVMVMLDALALSQTTLANVIAYLAVVRDHPNVARENGKMLLGSFMAEKWTPAQWYQIAVGVGAPVSLMPHFLNYGLAGPYMSIIDGASVWGGNDFGSLSSIDNFANTVRAAGKEWMAPIFPQDFRPKNGIFWEARNSRLFRLGWEKALSNPATKYVSIACWNDYSEHNEIAPSTGIQYAFADLSAYFSTWFKTGSPPRIVRDVLYYFHRVEHTSNSGTGIKQPNRFRNMSPPDQNDIEVLSFLTQAGQVSINGQIFEAPAGITSFTIPWAAGVPSFKLIRNNDTVIHFNSSFACRTTSDHQNLLYHAGSSSRPPVS